MKFQRSSLVFDFSRSKRTWVQVLHKDMAEDTTAHLARIGALFDKPQFSDVRVTAADGHGFYCHRAVLAACSKSFERAMLTEDMQHIQSALEVRLKDTSSATLQAVLRFCYTAGCHLTPDNVLPICALAEHFEVKALHSACVQFIEHNISVSSCCTMLEMAAQYNMEALRKVCWDMVLEHFDDACIHEGFVRFRYETLTALLESNELGTVSEFNVFLAAMRWVEADESREHFLDEVLGLIRFPTMDYEELGLVGKHPTAAGTAILKELLLEAFMYLSQTPEESAVLMHSMQPASQARFTPRTLPESSSWASLDLAGEICSFTMADDAMSVSPAGALGEIVPQDTLKT